jgi:hypothetical protein
VSGPAPETERERQLREVASRALTHPDPDGPVTVDLVPLGYPEDVPAELVDRTGLRLVGSVVRRRAGKLADVELIFDGAGEPDTVLSSYEGELIRIGWVRLDQMGPFRGGFEARGFGDMAFLADQRQTAMVNLHALDRADGGTDLRVRYNTAHVEEMLSMRRGMPHETSPLPRLRPPQGVRMQPEGHGGGGGRWSSAARARTEMMPMQLEAHFARQLESAGWGRVSGSADDFFAWSSWLVPAVPPAKEWRGVLEILAAFPGDRALTLWMERLPQ